MTRLKEALDNRRYRKFTGKYRLAVELMDLLVKERIIIDEKWEGLFRRILEGKYDIKATR